MTDLTIQAVGDVFVDRDEPHTAFHSARRVLDDGDVLFGNCEGVFADTWERAPSCGSPVVAPSGHAKHLIDAGFDVLSLANNHSVDGGYAAMLSCRDTLRSLGAATVGAGNDLDDAHAPAVLSTAAGTTVGFLAYTAVFPHGYEARAATPGLAALRAQTHYSPWETNEWNPGLAPKVTTEPFPQDLDRLRADLAELRPRVDVIVVSVHWGDFTRPYVLTDHERRMARAAVECGADIVVGHHHHLLRGVEFHRGRPIFYGLGHYLFDLPNLPERLARDGYLLPATPAEAAALRRRFGDYRIAPREGYPLLPFHEDSRMTGVAVIRVTDDGIAAGLRPAIIDADNEPIHVSAGSELGSRVVNYLRRCCSEEGLATRLVEPLPNSGLPADCVQVLPE